MRLEPLNSRVQIAVVTSRKLITLRPANARSYRNIYHCIRHSVYNIFQSFQVGFKSLYIFTYSN